VTEFRARILAALDAPLGGPLARVVRAAAGTAIVVEMDEPDRTGIALAELVGALARSGVPRGRQLVLLTGTGGGDGGEAARALRSALGVPVFRHEEPGAAFVAGRLADGTPVELDDELREAEDVIVAGLFAAAEHDGVRGGPAAIWPGLAPRAARETLARELAVLERGARPLAAYERSLAAASVAPPGFALLWSAHEPPEVVAGEAREAFTRAVARGWIDARLDARRSALLD